MILTAGCLFVYFMTFQKYGISADMLFQIQNNYFPAADSATDDVNNFYMSSDGRVYSPDDQNHILYIVQGA